MGLAQAKEWERYPAKAIRRIDARFSPAPALLPYLIINIDMEITGRV